MSLRWYLAVRLPADATETEGVRLSLTALRLVVNVLTRGITFEVTRGRQRSARAARLMICLDGLAALARSWWASR
jgi:hypothetical protein